jgi:cytochrome c biogenesis protein CcmG/thiol:disulfide interchange protein DsbE
MVKIARLSVLVMSVIVLSVILASCGGQREESQSGEAEAQSSAGGAVSQEQATGTGTDVGQMPPAFTLNDLSGNDVSLSDFAGKVIILDLWATWCPPCRQEIPFLVSLYEEYKEQGLAVVGVGLDRGGAEVLAPFVEANNVTYTILVGNEAVSRDYGVSSIPMTLMIGRDGLVASREIGFAPSLQDQMRSKVVELLSKAAPEA